MVTEVSLEKQQIMLIGIKILFKFTAISLFPEMFDALKLGITGRAQQKLIAIEHLNPRQFTEDNYQRVDDRPYGGPGMVMMVPPYAVQLPAHGNNNLTHPLSTYHHKVER